MFLISINLIQDTKRRTPNENLSKREIINSKLINHGKVNSAHEKTYSAQSFKAKVNSAQGNIQRRCILRRFDALSRPGACLQRTQHPGCLTPLMLPGSNLGHTSKRMLLSTDV